MSSENQSNVENVERSLFPTLNPNGSDEDATEKPLATQQAAKQAAKPFARQPATRPGIPFVTCPTCKQGDLCPRRCSSLKDWLAWLAGLTPYRCNRCFERSYHK